MWNAAKANVNIIRTREIRVHSPGNVPYALFVSVAHSPTQDASSEYVRCPPAFRSVIVCLLTDGFALIYKIFEFDFQ